MRTLLVVALVLAVAAPARATVHWMTGFDTGVAPADDLHYWGTITAGAVPPTMTTARLDPVAGNFYGLRIQPQTGAASYVVPVISGIAGGVTDLKLALVLHIDNAGGGGADREVAAFRDTGASGSFTRGAILVQKFGATVNGVRYYTLQARYGAKDQKVCSGSTQNGKLCTARTDCPEANVDEAQCGIVPFAETPQIAEGTNVEVTMTQANVNGTVTIGLYEGTSGPNPQVVFRGNLSRLVGKCSSPANKPCSVDGDCSGTCVTTNVVAPKDVALGATDTGTGTIDVTYDSAVVYDGTVRQNVRIESLVPNATVETGAWVHVNNANGCGDGVDLYKCLLKADQAESAVEHSVSSRPTMVVDMTNPSTPSPAPTPLAVAIEVAGSDKASGGGNGSTIRIDLKDEISTYTGGATFFLDDFPGTGGVNDGYYLLPPLLRNTQADGTTAWTTTAIEGMQPILNKTAGASNAGRLSTLIGSVLYQQANPTLPSVIPDRDQDGQKTLVLNGDSTWDNVDFQNHIVANVPEVDNVYFNTRGASKIGDSINEWTDDLEGVTGFLGLDVRRGAAGATADVVFLAHLANVSFPSGVTDPALCDADTNSHCEARGMNIPGYCEDNGGANQGHACHCERLGNETSVGYPATPAAKLTPGVRYCINAGAFKSSCWSMTDCACVTNADCARGGDVAHPATCMTPNPTGAKSCGQGLDAFGAVSFTGLRGSADDPVDANVLASRPSMCMSGCLNAPGCTTGVCVAHHTTLDVQRWYEQIAALTDARPTPAATPPLGGKPIVVYVIPPPAANLVWGETSRFAFGAYRTILRNWAKAHHYPFVDAWFWFYRQCSSMRNVCHLGQLTDPTYPCSADEDSQLCFRDYVHHTYFGQTFVYANAIVRCATNDGGTRTHDGVCNTAVTPHTCTDGLEGDTGCATDADCDTWSCDFGAQS